MRRITGLITGLIETRFDCLIANAAISSQTLLLVDANAYNRILLILIITIAIYNEASTQ